MNGIILLIKENIFLIVKVVIIVVFSLSFTIWLSRLMRKTVSKKYSAQYGLITGKIILYTGLTFLLIFILRQAGFKLSALLGAAGIVGLAIGFASQTSVSNIISGLFLIAERPFEVNDVISVGSVTGVVLSIDMLSVKLRTFDNKYVRIPNEKIIKSEVTNNTRFPIRRLDIGIKVAYKENLERIRKTLTDIAEKEPLCFNEPEPSVILNGLSGSSMDLLFLVWTQKSDLLKVKNALMEEIKKRFEKENIAVK
ncbi:MAG: mechanosensitive ion channel family protein [Spirochaetes bacterium]|nr:MAG: mechanosensitive ion channel family protein [Spirochaetota bacterium]